MRVFQPRVDSRRFGTDEVYACARSNGKVTSLFSSDEVYDSGSILEVSGFFVAYSWSTIPACKAACPPGVTGQNATEVLAARTGRTKVLDEPVVALELSIRGNVAWLRRVSGATRELIVWDRHGKRVVDTGVIPLDSFKLYRGELYWTRDGQRRQMGLA